MKKNPVMMPRVEKFINEGIELRKLKDPGSSGLFWYKPAMYEYKIVYDLDEAVNLTGQGWRIKNADYIFYNLVVHMLRDFYNGYPKH